MILDAAERRFAERGFAGVSMRGIAADAGLRNQAVAGLLGVSASGRTRSSDTFRNG
ncbi:MAG: TetR family transcriptional regulator [Candidatus Binatia bacterium]